MHECSDLLLLVILIRKLQLPTQKSQLIEIEKFSTSRSCRTKIPSNVASISTLCYDMPFQRNKCFCSLILIINNLYIQGTKKTLCRECHGHEYR